jgi:hypothetical protein
MTPVLNLIILFSLAVGSGPTASGGSWEKLYEAPTRNQWIFSVWLAKDGSWRAAGKNLILTGTAQGVRTTELGDYDVYSFGEDAAGTVIAVGSRQAIWEEDAHGFKRVHERPGPPQKGRAAHRDVLDGLGYFDPEHPDRLFAHASLAFALWRRPDGTWQLAEDDRPARRGADGPVVSPPKGCHIAAWNWLDRTEGFLECQEGQAYLYKDAVMTVSLGPIPKACRFGMATVVRTGNDLFASRSEQGKVWRLRAGTGPWTMVPGIEHVTSLQARNGCLLAGTKRAVYRRCETP